MNRRFLFVAALALLVTSSIAFSFDIAIYSDPLSWFNARYIWHHNEHPSQNYEDFLDSLGYTSDQMESVYRWYAEMGVTKVMVIYPYPSNFATNNAVQDCTHIGVMNWFYPGLGTMHGAKYVDGQFRDVQVGNLWPNENGYWSFDYSIPDPNMRRTYQPLFGDERSVVRDSGSARTMWRP